MPRWPNTASSAVADRGCLETVASTSTMIDLLSHGRNAPIGTEDIVRIALDGDPAALRVIEDAGLAVGRALANVCNLLNPEFIVVGGPLTGLGSILLDPVRRGLLRHVVPIVGESTDLAMSTLGSRAEALEPPHWCCNRPNFLSSELAAGGSWITLCVQLLTTRRVTELTSFKPHIRVRVMQNPWPHRLLIDGGVMRRIAMLASVAAAGLLLVRLRRWKRG